MEEMIIFIVLQRGGKFQYNFVMIVIRNGLFKMTLFKSEIKELKKTMNNKQIDEKIAQLKLNPAAKSTEDTDTKEEIPSTSGTTQASNTDINTNSIPWVLIGSICVLTIIVLILVSFIQTRKNKKPSTEKTQ